MRAPGISAFFPAYHDERNIARVVQDAIEVLDSIGLPYDITIIDDGSPDRTGEVADALARRHEQVRVIHHPQNLGYGATLAEGFQSGQREWVFYSDGDYQFDLADLRKLAALAPYSDLVVGFRYEKQYSLWRKFTSFSYNLLLRILFGLGEHDVDCAFKLVRRSLFDEITLHSRDAFIDAEIMLKARLRGYRVTEIGVRHYPREEGLSTGARPSVILRTIREILRFWRGEWREQGLPRVPPDFRPRCRAAAPPELPEEPAS